MSGLGALFGRENERELVTRLVRSHPLVTLVGPGGIGKTRLARAVSDVVADDFRGGVFFAELATADLEGDIAQHVAHQLGFDSADALLYGDLDTPRFIVLDNCETAHSGTAAFVRSVLSSGGSLTVLATSRVRLGVEREYVVAVGGLAVPDDDESIEQARSSPAVQLFLERARQAGLDDPEAESVEAATRLVRRLDGMPLAIELAAARTRVLDPGQILDQINDRLGVLGRAERSDRPDRHRSMHAVVETSLDPLEPDRQAAFRQLSVVNGPFDLDLATALLGSDVDRTVDTLSALIDASLVDPQVGPQGRRRYRILEPLRLVALEQLDERGERADVLDRLTDVMITYSDQFVAQVLDRFSPNLFVEVEERYGHLVQAIQYCTEADADAARSNRLFLPLFGASVRRSETARLARRVNARWTERAPLHAEAQAIMANAALFSGADVQAERWSKEVLDDPHASDLARMLAHRSLAYLSSYVGNRTAAQHHFDEAIRLGEPVSPAFTRELRLSSLAATADTDDPIAVEAAIGAVVAIRDDALEGGELVTAQWADTIEVSLLVVVGRADEALHRAERVMSYADRTGYSWSPGAANQTLALAMVAHSGWAAAADQFRRAFDICIGSGDLGLAAWTVATAAALQLRQGRVELAQQFWAALPSTVGRTIVPSPFRREHLLLEERFGTRQPTDVAASIRQVRALFAESAADGSRNPSETLEPRGDVDVIRFGDYEIDPNRFEIRNGGSRVHVEPQVFDVVLHLARRAGEVVTKENILDDVWGDRFVSESALTSRIKAARRALGDDGGTQAVIRTVRGRGYSFVATIDPTRTPTPETDQRSS